MTWFCYLLQDERGNLKPEHEWPSDDYWMKRPWLDPEAEWEPEASESEDELGTEPSESEDELQIGAIESKDELETEPSESEDELETGAS